MTNATIDCPKCNTKIEITKAMTAQVEARIRQQVEGEAAEQQAALQKEAEKLAEQKAKFEEAEAELARSKAEMDRKVKDAVAAGVEEQVAAQRAEIAAQARKQAEADLAVEQQERDERIKDLEGKLSASKKTELEMLKRERELTEKTESLELEVARKVKEESEAIREAAKKQAAEEHLLKDKEKEEQIAGLRKQIDDLKRKAEQGSQQAQGEALELVVEDVLARAFPHDEIAEIAKGVKGGDWLQHVREPSGLECGSILWETKNAKNWNPAWLPKLRKDQREAKAAIAILVTEVMPAGHDLLTEIDGVWVCTRACAETLGSALRAGLVEVAKARQAAEGKQDKIERVYDYLSGTEFRQRVGGMVEPLVQMQAGLASEKRSMTRIWAAREKQIEAAVLNMHGMYGDLQGIVGASTLPTLEQMDLPRLASGEDNGDVPAE